MRTTTVDVEQLRVLEPADRRLAPGLIAAAIFTDMAVRSGVAVVSGSILVAVVAASMLVSGRLRTTESRVAVALATVFGLFLTLRQSPWIVLPDIIVCAGLLTLGAILARERRSLTGPRLVFDALGALVHGLCAPAFAWPALRPKAGMQSKVAPVVRGLAIAVPVVGVLGLLLASADAVFASWFHIDIDLPSLVSHAVLAVIGVWGLAGLLRTSSSTLLEPPDVRPRLGRTETILLLAGLDALFGVFALAQLVALSSAGERILKTAGLTYAQYARTGFFQLLAVAAITLAALAAVRALADRTPLVIGLALGAVAGTLGVVAVAIKRLALYEDAYGFTMLRLYSKVFALWIGIAFVIFAVAMLRDARWFVAGALAAGVALLLALNVLNPEAHVARRNYAQPRTLDAAYVEGLGTDAAPVIFGRTHRVTCSTHSSSWASYNHSQAVCDRLAAPNRKDSDS